MGKQVSSRNFIILTLFACLFLCGCPKKIGRDFMTGVSSSVRENKDSLGADLEVLASKVGTGVLSDSLDVRLKRLVAALTDSIVNQVSASRDSLLGKSTRDAVDSILQVAGGRASEFLKKYRNDLVGDSAAQMVKQFIKTALTDSLNNVIRGLREQLLGPESRASLDTLLQSAGGTIGKFLRTEIWEEIDNRQDFLKKNVNAIVISLGGVIAGCIALAALFRRRRNKMTRLVEMLTTQIHDIKSQASYDELVGNIRKESLSLGYEQDMRKILTNQGILGGRAWKPIEISKQASG